jgi:hypothetical protein
MATKRVAQKRPTTKPDTVPLREVTITWPYRSPYMNEPKEVTITGEHLARVLDVIRTLPYADDDARLSEAEAVSWRLEGVSALMEALGETDFGGSQLRSEHAARALADYVDYLRMRVGLNDSHWTGEILKTATVTTEPAQAVQS